MKITTKAHYGLQAMCELARNYGNDPLSVREISDLQNCSESYLEQIISKLKKSGLIESVRGKNGGYVLSRPPESISTGEIIRALEGPIGFTECSNDEQHDCSYEPDCCSKEFWKELYKIVNSFLENKKLSDITVSGS